MKLIYTALSLIICFSLGCTYAKDHDLSEPQALKKSQFDGEWFTRATLVSKHSHSSLAFMGMECPVERVKFEITKDKLLAYRSYDKGSDQVENNRNQTLVAAFNIVKHFDLKRGYDAKNGEANNVFFENTSDRPWNERDYLRVDWSENLTPHLECNRWLQSITTANIGNTDITDPSEPFRVRIEKDYMESTVDALVEPDVETCKKIGEWNCHSAEYRVKFSFKRVEEKNDYEKKHYPDAQSIRFGTNHQGLCIEGEKDCRDTKELWLYADARRTEFCDPLKHNIGDCVTPMVKLNAQFGFFRTEAQNYDRKEGFTRRGREQLINRWNLWQQSHDENGNVVPIEMRSPKKIVYYLNAGFPTDLLPSVRNVEKEWNTAFANVIAKIKSKCDIENAKRYAQRFELSEKMKARGIERIVSDNLEEACTLIYEETKNLDKSEVFFTGNPNEIDSTFGRVFEIRVNDCNKNNITAYLARNDLSHVLADHGISEINDDNVEHACAIAEWAKNEFHIAEAFTWQQLGDLRYSFINAVAKPDGAGLLGYGPSGVDPKTGEIISGNANIYLSAIANYAARSATIMDYLEKLRLDHRATASKKGNDDDVGEFSAYVGQVVGSMSKNTYRMPRPTAYQTVNFAETAKLKIFAILNEWPAEEIGSAFNEAQPGRSEVDSLLALIAGDKSNVAGHQLQLQKNRAKEEFFSERSACFSHAANEPPYTRMTKELRGMSFADRVKFIKAQVFEAVLKHELGHTVGLRHNFKGAYDALNYPPNFWGVNTFDYRMRDGLSKEELRSASVMDYHKRFNSDFSGLGLYDYAALLSGYAGKIEVFDTSKEDFVPKSLMGRLSAMDYRDMPYLFSGGDAEHRILQHYSKVKDSYLRGDGSAHMQIETLGLTGKPENFYKRRLVNYEELKKRMLERVFVGETKNFTQVPYAFCTDGQVGGSDIACQPFVYGSSPSEIVDDAIADYELAHAIQGMGGDTLPSSVPSYLNYAYQRIYAPILRTYQRMYALADSDAKVYPAVHDLAVGAKRGLEFISRVLQAVEPGEYCKKDSGNYVPKSKSDDCIDPVVIDDFMGMKYRSKFGDELAGPQKSIGYVYDKILALLALIDDHASLNHEFSSWQHKNYSIGFYRVFTPQLITLFTNLYTDQWENLAPTLILDKEGKPSIQYRDLFDVSTKKTDVDLPKIKPSFSSSLRDYAILFSMAGLSNPLDHKLDFAKRAQISLVGGNDSPELADGVEQVVFRDPNTGIGYRAFAHDQKDLSPGYLLLKDAYHFVCDGKKAGEIEGPWFQARSALSKAKAKLEKVRASLSATATDEELIKDEEELVKARQDFVEKGKLLNEKIRVIDLVRTMSEKFGR